METSYFVAMVNKNITTVAIEKIRTFLKITRITMVTKFKATLFPWIQKWHCHGNILPISISRFFTL